MSKDKTNHLSTLFVTMVKKIAEIKMTIHLQLAAIYKRFELGDWD
jgi:hypothetical protein